MKSIVLIILCAAVLTAGTVAFLPEKEKVDNNNIMSTSKAEGPAMVLPQLQTLAASANFDGTLILRVLTETGIQEMSLKDYLIGVLLAEMPANFPEQALMAQAVASRTFALRQAEKEKHSSAHVCVKAACCQGWQDRTEYGGEAAARICQAVEQTDGLVLTYEGALIEATFFSCSGGQTESAVAVWGGEVPYLQSVTSPGEEAAEPYEQSVFFEKEYFARIMRGAYPDINLSGSPEGWFGAVSYTDGGGIDCMFIGGVPVTGTSLRSLLSLASTNIAVEPSEEGITLTTLGFGHRVGMSQYGAKAMAENGSNFSDILSHYYTDAKFTQLLHRHAQHLSAG